MELQRVFEALGISLGLGLLVGIQRERVSAPLAGVRTFALITLFGTLTGLLSATLGPWVVAGGFVGVTAVLVVGNLLLLRQESGDPGITTEIAILLMYAIGVSVVLTERSVAVVLGAGVAVLLYAKPVTHEFVRRLGEADMKAMMQFVLISLVILPVLPDRTFGPYDVLNPRDIWWMVVLVVGISLAGYVALKLKGEGTGVLLAGAIGGLVSSTATTVSFARRAAQSGSEGAGKGGRQVRTASLVILVASAIVFARVVLEIHVVAPSIARQAAWPVITWFAAAAVMAVVVWRSTSRETVELPEPTNPAELRPALIFGLVFATVLLVVAAAQAHLGARGIYLAAALSGLTDVDAITLSTSRLAEGGGLEPSVVWRAVVVAVMANLVFKAAVVRFLGGPALGRRVALQFAVLLGVGVALLSLWPG